ncbi:hypothetical protein [Polaribacter aquimarinus]|uniref:Uncharacterized protein n=1 Tax=Polaribacter aquimarinus TaxID=2100726 RepID=A0A2U2JAD8_9FLAO|nr:hypothetical protein [Polaribacter aquimarinus]PWG05294.1 hypothetical protein DIS07_08640 [Polaribacter aquimarinus]
MSLASQTYQVIDGNLEINNSEIKINYRKWKYVIILFKFFMSLLFISTFIKKVENYENIIGVYENIKLWFFGIVAVLIIYDFFRSLFKKVWVNKIDVNDLIKIEVYDENEEDENIDEDSKIEITLFKNNGRKKVIELQKEKNQIEYFLKDIKKRNSRIEIKYL